MASVNYQTAATSLAVYAEDLAEWAEERQTHIFAHTSHVTLFTSDTHHYHHHHYVRLRETLLPHLPYPSILGVTFDPTFSFNRQIQNVRSPVRERTKILKALARTNYGQQKKKALVMTYKALI